MAYYPEMNSTDTEDLFDVFRYVNTVSGNIFIPILLLVIGAIITIGSSLTGKPVYRGFTFAAFVCSILGIILSLLGFMNIQYMYFCFFLVGVGVIWTRLAEAMS
jgi:predicted MFS family arabinose efflux permease